MKNVGRTIKLIREATGLKQEELAKRINVSSNYISLIENKKKKPSLKFLEKVADEFNLPISLFMWNDIEIENINDNGQKEVARKINDLYWDLIKLKIASA